MEIIYTNFYSTLYDEWLPLEETTEIHNKIQNSIKPNFINKTNHELEHPNTLEEIMSFATNKYMTTSHKLLLQILCLKSYSHTLVGHVTNR
jgi:hypothetical protein